MAAASGFDRNDLCSLASRRAHCAAEGGAWSVSKSSGEVWITSGNVQQASLKPSDNLKPGDTIRTGRNGRVLLVRGEETILIAPNSVIGLPAETKGRAVDDDLAAGGLDPARCREAQRQAFRGRNPLPRRCGQRHPVPRLRECRQHQRRCDAGTGRSRRLQVGPDRPGVAGPARDRVRTWQGRSFTDRFGHIQSDRARQASRFIGRSRSGAERRPVFAPRCRQRAGNPCARHPRPIRGSRRRSGK